MKRKTARSAYSHKTRALAVSRTAEVVGMAPSTFLVLLIASLLPFLCSSDDANQLDGPLLIDDIDRKLSLTKDYYSAPKSKKEPKSKHKKVELPDLEEIPERVIPQCPAPALPVNRYNKAPVYTPGNENCTSSSGIFENHSNDCRASCSRYGYRYGVGECEASCDKEGDDRCYPLLRRCKNPTFWSVISKRTGKVLFCSPIESSRKQILAERRGRADDASAAGTASTCRAPASVTAFSTARSATTADGSTTTLTATRCATARSVPTLSPIATRTIALKSSLKVLSTVVRSSISI